MALDLYLSGEMSDHAAEELGLVEDSDDESMTCPECGEGDLEKTDDCSACPECFFSPCS